MEKKKNLDPIQFESIDSVLMMDRSYVIQGSYTKSDVVSTLTEYGYTEQDTRSGYTILTHSWGLPMAVGDTTLLFVDENGPTSGQQILRSIIDAKVGETKRYADQNEAFGALSNHLSGNIIWSGVRQSRTYASQFYPLAQIDGASLKIEGESSRYAHAYVLGDGAANESDIKQNVRSNASGTSDGVSFSQEDNVLLAEMTKQTNKIEMNHVYSAI